jgi:hypothetical protein
MACPRASRPVSFFVGLLRSMVSRPVLDIGSHGGRIERPRQAQCPRKRPTSLGEVETPEIGVQVHTSPGHPSAGIGDHLRPEGCPDRHDTQQVGLDNAKATPDTRTQWTCLHRMPDPRVAFHSKFTCFRKMPDR